MGRDHNINANLGANSTANRIGTLSTNAPYIETGPGPFGADAAGTAILLSDINHGAVYLVYLDVERHLEFWGCAANGRGDRYAPYYFSLTNMTSVFDPGAVVRQSTVTPAAPTAICNYNVDLSRRLP